MSLTTLLGLGVIALVVIFVFAPSALAGLVDDTSGFFTATQLKPRIGADEVICDLRIEVEQKLTDSDIFFLIDTQPVQEIVDIDTQWFNCFQFSQASFIDYFDTNHIQASLLDFAVATPQTITTEIKQSDSFGIGEIINTPYDNTKTFVVSDIPARDFILEIRHNSQTGLLAGSSYNGNAYSVNEPIKVSIQGIN